MPADRGPWLPDREFRYVVTEFSLDPGRIARFSGYRPIWRLTVPGEDPVLVGMCALTLVEKDRVEPGETQVVHWAFVPEVQGYIEHLLRPGARAEICGAGTAPVPARDYDRVVAGGRPVHIYRSRILRGYLGWEYAHAKAQSVGENARG